MFTVEDQLYVRFILLLARGGSAVLRKIVFNGLLREHLSLRDFLKLNKSQITNTSKLSHKHLELMYPNLTDPPDISIWDISLLCYISLEFFVLPKHSSHHKAVTVLRDMRNKFQAHYPNTSLDVETYFNIRKELETIILTLSSGFSEKDKDEIKYIVESTAEVHLETKTVMNEIRMFYPASEFSEQLQKQMDQIAIYIDNSHKDILEIKQELVEIKRQIEERDSTTVIVATVFGQVRVSALDKNTADMAANLLLNSANNSLRKEDRSNQPVDHFVQDIKGTGVKIDSIREGSVLFTFQCSTIQILLNLIDYFTSEKMQYRLDDIAATLEDRLKQKIQLTAVLLLEPLKDVIKTLYKQTKSLNLALTCTGVDGLQHVLNVFEGEGASNSVNDLSNALSKDLGQQISADTSLDIEAMRMAIASAKGQLAQDERSSQETSERKANIEAYKFNIPLNIKTEPEVSLNDEKLQKVYACIYNDIQMWRQESSTNVELACVCVDDIEFNSEKKTITLCFILHTDKELEKFKTLTCKSKSKTCLNTLSKTLTDYVEQRKTISNCKIPGVAKSVLKVVLPDTVYYLAKSHFSKSMEEEETTDSNSPKKNKADSDEEGMKSAGTPSRTDDSKAYDTAEDLHSVTAQQKTGIGVHDSGERKKTVHSSLTGAKPEVDSHTQRVKTDNILSDTCKPTMPHEGPDKDDGMYFSLNRTSNALHADQGDSEQNNAMDYQINNSSDSFKSIDIETEESHGRSAQSYSDGQVPSASNIRLKKNPGRESAGKIKHTFIVCLSDDNKPVSFHIVGNASRRSVMHPHSDSLFSVSLNLPADLPAKTQYFYKYKQGNTGNDQESFKFTFDGNTIHRDLIDDAKTEKEIFAHFDDILSCSVCHIDFTEKQLLEQIVKFGSLPSGVYRRYDTKTLVEKLRPNDKPSDKYLFLLAVIIAVLCEPGKQPKIQKFADQQFASRILSALPERSINDLPKQVQDKMRFVCRQLSEIKYGDQFCTIFYLESCYPFVGDRFVLDHVREHLKSFDDMNLEHPDTELKCQSICKTLFERSCDQIPDNLCRQSLTLILEKIPKEIALSVYLNLKMTSESTSEDENFRNNILTDAVTKIIWRSINGLKEKRQLSSLIKFAKVACQRNTEDCDIFCNNFENAIIHVLEYKDQIVNNSIREEMKALLKETNCFKQPSRQEKLIETVAESGQNDIFNLFYELFDADQFLQTYANLNISVYEKWLLADKPIHRHSIYESLRSTLCRYCHIKIIGERTGRKDILRVIKRMIANQLNHLNATELLRAVVHVEDLCDKNALVGDLLKDQVLDNLTSIGLRPYDTLQLLCDAAEGLCIKYIFTANLVGAVIDRLFERQDDQTDFEYFISLMEHVRFLTLVGKSQGEFHQMLLQNKTYEQITMCIKKVTNHVLAYQVSLPFVKLLEAPENKQNARKLMQLQGYSPLEIDFNFQVDFVSVNEEACSIIEVLDVLKGKKPELPGISSLRLKASDIQQRLHAGTILAVDCRPENHDNIWNIMRSFPQLCTDLRILIKSDVFWNLTMPELNRFLQNQGNIESEKEYETDIKYLFDTTVIKEDTFECVLSCIRWLLEEGKPLFQKGWIHLEDDQNLLMSAVKSMFKAADVIKEIELASTVLGRSINSLTQRTLELLEDISNIQQTVRNMKLVLDIFCPPSKDKSSFLQASETIEDLCQPGISTYKFSDVQNSLMALHTQTNILTRDSLLILSELGRSSHLIDFLRSTAHEDIRTLVDAVEHISEQHVQETTVSSLIEVKRFVNPFMEMKAANEEGSKWLFETINKQVAALGSKAQDMVSKIDDCRNNIHSLKALIDTASDRGELTKVVVTNIIEMGEIKFKLENKEKNIIFKANYTQNNIEHTKDEKTLIDLRSRVLLLMNTESSVQNCSIDRTDFGVFVNYIDLCSDIKNTLSKLFSSGHVNYTHVTIYNAVSELHETNEQLLKDLNDWEKDLAEEQKNFYLLNFIYGRQIPILYHYLHEKNGEKEDIVQTILKSIHPEMGAEKLRKSYKKRLPGNKSMLKSMGKSLQLAHHGLQLFRRSIKPNSEDVQQITDSVPVGQVRIVNLESNCSVVIKTILALYKNTTQFFPQAHQLLFCNRGTLWSDIGLLLERCIRANEFHNVIPLFCIANVEQLRREIQDRLIQAVDAITGKDFLLAIVCQGTEHLFRSKLGEKIETVRPLSDEELKRIVQNQFPKVLTYTSDIAGLGKTTAIYSSAMEAGYTPKSVHVSGTFEKGKMIEQLRNLNLQHFHALHIDIGNMQNPNEINTFLFELIILNYVAEESPFYLATEKVYLEVSNTINDTLVNALHFITSFKRVHINLENFDSFLPSRDIASATQVVCHYLNGLETGTIDTTEIHFTGSHQVKPLEDDKCRTLLAKYIHLTGETSYNNIHIFLNVLAEQLKKMSGSAFFRTNNIVDMMDGSSASNIRSALVGAMINVALGFASRSVKAIRSVQSRTSRTEPNKAANNEEGIAEPAVQRVEYMIRWEDTNHLIFVFHNQNIQTLTPMYRDISRVEERVKNLFERQMNKTLINFTDIDQRELQSMLQKIARKNINPLPDENLTALATDYALTPDNLLKMVLIMMRIQANVPVIIMGDTGCGKTSLIRYLSRICEIQFSIMNIHAGVTLEAIIQQIKLVDAKCCNNFSQQIWLFLDEINTSEHLGVISDAICHHRCNGKVLAPNLVIMGACNPYKMKTDNATHTAGLNGKVRSDELSRLVYRVLPLPETMIDYVWDFGSLSDKDEEKYIQKMVAGVLISNIHVSEYSLLTKLLSVSQSFVRETENATFSVSLRDVLRCTKLVKWFDQTLPVKAKVDGYVIPSRKAQMQSIVLALALCYHSRFAKKSDRRSYRLVLESVFVSHGCHEYREDVIHSVIKDEQNNILKRLDLPPGIARNTALRENVFMLLVCILNKIPIFLVGKPGCSKSLAMQVIRSNLRGNDSKDDFFKTLPQLHCVSFQGSESSTAEGISTVFEKAEKYQKSYTRDGVLSVVILDEIGLAEISIFNPLKVLHNLLEPDGQSTPNVAVVGISNWALDASKMNRAIHLSRPDMDTVELIETGVFICESFTENIQSHRGLSGELQHTLSTDDIREDLKDIAKAYSSYSKTLKYKNFHGLRDFYYLVKFIIRTLTEEKCTLSYIEKAKVIMKGLERNFGGLPKEKQILLHHFKERFSRHKTDKQSAFDAAFKDQSLTRDLVVSNIKDINARHLMLITKGESVLAIVEDILRNANREKREIIFGSHFEDDLTDDYNYRTLSKIIMCMEQGIVLILKDLEKIYGSLYDMLNQNYTRIGHKNNCRVALGPYSKPFCHVAESFRCIVLVDERKLDYTDPPFLNRFEKQYLAYGNIIDQQTTLCLKKVEMWLEEFSNIEGKSFTKEDMFPVYNQEMVVSLVTFKRKNSQCKTTHDIVTACKKELLWMVRPEAVMRLSKSVSIGKNSEIGELKNSYFELPVHDGLQELVKYQMQDLSKTKRDRYLTIVFTNSKIHINIENCLAGWTYQVEKLQTFKSERELSSSIEKFWKDEKCEILFLQCNAVEDEEHIMLTKTIIERYGVEAKEETIMQTKKLVYFAIHLDGSDISTNTVSQINYLSGWKLLMMDTLKKPDLSLRYLCATDLLSVIEKKLPLTNYLKNELFWAFTRISYGSFGRDHKSILTILEKMKNDHELLSLIEDRICSDIRDNFRGKQNTNWQIRVACDVNALSTSTHFVDALESFVLSAIKHPLAKIVFKLENLGAVQSYFSGDEGRTRFWKYIFQSETLFSISEIQAESGPWCYSCDRADLSLVMPFSRAIFESIEATREDFLLEIPRLRARCDINENDALPLDVTNELVIQQQTYMFKKIPDLQQYEYDNMKTDYVEDFCNLVSFTTCANLTPEARIYFTKYAITNDIDFKLDYSDIFARMHCTFWENARLFSSFLLLIESCVEVFEEKEVLEMFKNTVNKNEMEVVSVSLALPSFNTAFKDDSSLEQRNADLLQSSILESKNISKGESTLRNDAFHQFISLVCLRILPTKTCLQKFDSARQWQLQVRNVMTVAAEVSREPKTLHALRFCDDIATHFLFPLQQPITELETIGNLLTEHELDSQTVFEAIKKLLDVYKHQVLEGIKACKVHRLLSEYLIRCMTADPETTAYTFLFKLIKEENIPDDCVGQFKAPLHFFFCLEQEVNKEFLYEIVRPGAESFAQKDVFSQSNFLTKLDVVLKTTSHSKANCSFNVLIVDILEEFYRETEYGDYSGLLLQCGTILQTNLEGLTFIAAVSLLKVILARIANMVSENKIQKQTILLNALNATYSGINENKISQTIMIYLLKSIANNCTLNEAMRHHKVLAQKCSSLDAIKWTNDYIQVCIERNPLSLFVSEVKPYGISFILDRNEKLPMLKTMSRLIDISQKSSRSLLLLFSLVQREVYLKRFFDDITDSSQLKLDMLANYVQTSEHTEHTKQLLFCLMGKNKFKVDTFVHGVETSARHYFILSILLSSYGVMIANQQFQSGTRLNAFSMCLLKPKDLKYVYLPGFPDTSTNIEMLDTHAMSSVQTESASCTSCSLRLTFKRENPKYECPVCKKQLETETRGQHTAVSYPPTPRCGFFDFRHFVNEHFQVRNLSPVTCNILYLIVKGYILGSAALNVATRDEIFLNPNTEHWLWEDIIIHWTNIAKLLNFDDHHVTVFISVVLYQTEKLICKYDSAFYSAKDRDVWEKKFDRIVRNLERERFSVIIDQIRRCDEHHGFPKQTVELMIREADDISCMSTEHQNTLLPGLFRVSGKPSKSDFIFQLLPVKNNYQFLSLALSCELRLNLPQYIHNIIQWHLVTVVHTCFSLKSYECSKMTVEDFLDKIPGSGQRDLVRKRFEAFKATWGKLTKTLDKNEKFKPLQSINTQSSLHDCLILEENSNVYKVLSYLVGIQNDFIDRALSLCFECDNLYFLSRDVERQGLAIIKNLPITETRQEHFLGMSFNWNTKLMQDSYSQISYGQGRCVHYDFGSVEKELIAELLVGKAYLNLSTLPQIIFTDQLFRKYVSLIEEVCVSVKQEPLPQTAVHSIKKNNEESRSMAKDLINCLDMVMTLLQKMKCESQTPLVEFAEQRKTILGRTLPLICLSSRDSNIKLCHVVSLHELLEELCADPLIDGLDEKYCAPLDDQDMQEHFENMPVISMKTAETVVRTIKRFVYRCMSLGETVNPKQPLIEYLSHKSFWPDNSFTDKGLRIEDTVQTIEKVIQTDVQVCHVQSIVLLLTDKIERLKQGEDRPLETVINDWKTKHVKKEEDSRVLKRRRMLQFKKT